jgi:uncharacterized surface protein with fasciclin (FAS1) repeats
LYISRIAGLIKRKFFVFSFFLPSFFCFADFREITTAEYFIGTDPGEGNGTSLSPHDGSFSHSLETILDTNLSVNSLSLGTHILNIRYKDDNGTWGEILKHPFTVFDPAPDLNRSNSSGNYNLQGIHNLAAAEYFIGTDPGEGNGTSLSPHDGSFSHSLETILDTNLSVNSLSLGTHILNIRYKDDNGTWGEILKHPFTVFDPAPDLNRSNSSGNYNLQGIHNLAAAEYFIGTDPGEGNGTSLSPHDGSFSHSLETILDTNLSVNSLSLGTHILNIRYKDDNGTWGGILKHPFTVFDPAPDLNRSNSSGNYNLQGIHNLAAAEYFIGTDPGEGNGTSLSPHDGSFSHSLETILDTNLSVNSLSLGTHILNIRYKDDNGTWGEILKHPFTVFDPAPDLNRTNSSGNYNLQGIHNLAAAEYFIGTDPGEGNGTSLSPHDGSFSHSVESIVETQISVHGLSLGIHQIGIRYKDDNGTWGEVLKNLFKIEAFTGNYHPTNLILNGNSIFENQPAGSTVGTFSATDPDGNGSLTYSLIDSNSSSLSNHRFLLEANGTLKTESLFDYESNNSYSIRVQAKDEENATTEGNFTILITNLIEDLDGDGIEDHFDHDDDNDGFSDAEEIAFGSDPRDDNSIANSHPRDLNTTSLLAFYENFPIGTFVGQFSAVDPDPHAILTFSLTSGFRDNDLFRMESNGTLRTASFFDFETNNSVPHSFLIEASVRDQYGYKADGNFTISLLNINEPPFDLNASAPIQVLENQPAGLKVAQFSAQDPDTPTTLTYNLVGRANHNQFFSIDHNGTIRTVVPLDYEANASLTIRIKVRDQHNAWVKQDFTVQVVNEVEDFDGDGIEDAYDPDNDNDGFSNAEEIAYGSNPWDANRSPMRLPPISLFRILRSWEINRLAQSLDS